jgi:phospholipid transport system substrate-binding protein
MEQHMILNGVRSAPIGWGRAGGGIAGRVRADRLPGNRAAKGPARLQGLVGGLARALAGLAAVVMLALGGVAAHAGPAAAFTPVPGSPEANVKRASDAIQQLLVANRATYDKDPERVHRMVDAALTQVVDYDGIAKSVMASSYRQATDAQRRRFADVFRASLVRTYTKAMLQFVDFRMSLLAPNPAERRPDRGTVRVQAVAPDGKVYPMEYSVMKMPAGDWRIRNVIVNGINLGLTYRNQFAAAVTSPANRGDLDKVIAGWTTAQVVPREGAAPR